MNRRSIALLLMTASLITSVAVFAATPVPGTCPNDSKLLNAGPTQISGEGPGTWWGLVINGLLVAGFVEEDDQIDYLNDIFGTSLGTLDELKTYNLQLVADTWDENHNGYVCAFQLRGTRAHFDNPYVDLTFFGVSDDRVGKNSGCSACRRRRPRSREPVRPRAAREPQHRNDGLLPAGPGRLLRDDQRGLHALIPSAKESVWIDWTR